jgi:hypothetical protein
MRLQQDDAQQIHQNQKKRLFRMFHLSLAEVIGLC